MLSSAELSSYVLKRSRCNGGAVGHSVFRNGGFWWKDCWTCVGTAGHVWRLLNMCVEDCWTCVGTAGHVLGVDIGPEDILTREILKDEEEEG